jgi:hypothetical protein
MNIAWTGLLGFCFHWQIEEVFKARLLGGLMNSNGGEKCSVLRYFAINHIIEVCEPKIKQGLNLTMIK